MAYVLQTVINARLAQLIDEHAIYLCHRTTDTLEQMRINQGVVMGLRMAMVAVEQGAKEVSGE